MTGRQPPRLAAWLAEHLLAPDDAQRLLGDLDEEFTDFQHDQRGAWRAHLWYWRQVLASTWILRSRQRGVLDALSQDVRYAIRRLRASPAFTLASVVTLALGIGATTAIFSVVDAVVLQALPYSQPERILRAWTHQNDGNISDFSFRVLEYRELATRSEVFEAVGAEFPWTSTVLLPGQEPRQVQGRMVTPDFFRVFGTGPTLGRMFSAQEISGGDALVVLVSHDFWSQHLGADPDVLGRVLDFGGTSYTVIGVLPTDYRHVSGLDSEVYIPYTVGTAGWVGRWLDVYGRLQPGVTESRAAEEIDAVITAIGESDRRSAGWHGTVEGLHTMVVGDVRPAIWATLATVALVLLIACVNVANLTLARASARVSELSIRKALGAGRGRILTQLLIENLVLAVGGGLVGLGAAQVGLKALIGLAPRSLPRITEATVSPTVLTFALVVTLTTGLVFGLVPAIRASGPAVGDRLGGRRGPHTGRRFGGLLGGLVVAEVGLALTLLVSAGLMVRTVQNLTTEDMGFERSGALTFRVEVPASRWPDASGAIAFFAELREQLLLLPGVTAVGAGADLPVSGQGAVARVNSEERVQAGQTEAVTALQRRATTGFFEALGTPLLAGRGFSSQDREGSRATTIISQSLASRLFPGQDPIGRRVGFGNQPDDDDWMTVVGVVADIRYRAADLVDDPQIYEAHPHDAVREMAVVVRSSREPATLVDPAKEVLHQLDPEIAMHSVVTLDGLVDRALAGQRFTTSLFSLFAVVALSLTVAGIYGVLSFVVGRRRGEMGLRKALGAHSRDVIGLVVRDGMVLILGGLVLGLVGSLVASRLLANLLYGVSASDPTTYAAVIAILALSGLAACYLPARDGARVDPMTVLRAD